MPAVKVVGGPNRGQVFDVADRPISLGRLEENDIGLNDPSVSSHHARIVPHGEGVYVLQDLGSRNGTFVNANRVYSVELTFGDRIRIGVSELVFGESAEAVAPVTAPASARGETSIIFDKKSEEESEIVFSSDSNIVRTYEIAESVDKETLAQKNLEVLFEVVRQCSAVLASGEILERILTILVATFRAERGFIMLLEARPDGRYQEKVAAVHNRSSEETKISVSSSIIERVVETRTPLLIFDAQKDARFSASDSVVDQNLRSVMCAPILRDNRIVGLVHLDSDRSWGLFGREDLELLKVICDEVALSIENAKLYEAVRRLSDHNATILQCLGEGLLVVDNGGLVTTLNRRAEEILEVAANQVVGQPIATFPVLGDVARLLGHVLETGRRAEPEELEVQVRPDLARPLRISTSVLADEDGSVTGAIARINDLTEEQELVKRVKHSERLAAMGEAVAGVAHELRNPLTVMRGLTQLIMKRFEEGESEREYCSMVIDGIDRASRIIRELLNFARDTRPTFAPCEPGDLARAVARDFEGSEKSRGKSFEAKIEEGLPRIVLDSDKIRQVLLNLLWNAAEACDTKGGRILLDVRGTPSAVEFQVKDDGSGMTSEVAGKIFEPFFTSKEDGTGLGLYISRKLVEQQAGEIQVESEAGVGSTFTVRLPREKRRGLR